jgi:thiamine biosynthesis lipoprotein
MPAEPVERSWRAMGSAAALAVVGGDTALAARAIARVDDLEDKWSRFRETSDVRRVNRHAGSAVRVNADTVELVAVAIEAWKRTAGAFDPTVGGAVIDAGYDESFDRFDGQPRSFDRNTSRPARGASAIELDVDAGTVAVPRGVQLDFGGLGKGLAADLVVAELLDAGADGAMVSLGGDLRVGGIGPDAGGAWLVGVADPSSVDVDVDVAVDLATVALSDGGVATSSTQRRRWRTVDGGEAHHVIDPRTGAPSTSPVIAATVIAADAATAEVAATACVVGGVADGSRAVDGLGAGALLVERDGRRHVAGSFEAFLTTPFPLTSVVGS